MKKIIIIFLLGITVLFTIAACKQEIKKPDDLLSRTLVKEIIKEVYLTKSIAEVQSKNSRVTYQQILHTILKEKGIQPNTFEQSHHYYMISNADYDIFLEEIKNEVQASIPQKDTIPIKK